MVAASSSRDSYDAIVIGTGQAGKPLSIALAEASLKTAVIESGVVGGTCINVGCTPTKTMAASARVAHLARRAADYGVHAGSVQVDLSEVKRRKQSVVDSFRDGSRKRLESTPGLDLVFGEARFTGSRTIAVRLRDGGMRSLTAARIFINTGCRPAPIRFDGSESVPMLDSSSIMELDVLPEHLVVLGGGYVGLEFGQMFRRFGSRVTIVHRGAQLLSREDTDVAEEVAKILRQDGLEILLSTTLSRATPDGDDVTLALHTPEGARSVRGSHLLAAGGRTPNTERLDLPAAGVATDARGFVLVNERLETTAPGVYALGDVKGGPAFTHISYDDFRILRTNLLEQGDAATTGRLVPYTVFIDPQLGRVGLTETEARAGGLRIRVAKLPMTRVARAIEVGETRGFMKAIVDAESGQILGGAMLGIEGGELMSVLQVAMMGRLHYAVIKEGIFAHPTLAESLNNLFMAMDA